MSHTAMNFARVVTATVWLAATAFAAGIPVISSFQASPTQIPSGQQSTLSWSVSGATSVKIDPAIGTVTGTSVKVQPTATTTYTLTATNSAGVRTATVAVTVVVPPVISSFTASPTVIASGQSSTLNWAVSGASSLRIDPAIGTLTGTSLKVSPKVNTIYTLTATNAAGSRTATVTVSIGTPPVIVSFAATPSLLTAGSASTLKWTVNGAASLKIDPGVGVVTGTTVQVRPTANTTYTLTATNAYGSATSTATIVAGAAPVINSFTASPAKVAVGQNTTLSWSVSGSPALMLNPGIGPVSGTSATVKMGTSTTFTLTATNAFGKATANVTVAAGSLPVINSFWTNPNMSAGPGVPTTLTWTTTGASTVSIDNGVGKVSGSSVSVSPSGPTTYTMTASNDMGSATAKVSVSYMPLTRVNSQLYNSEHALFIIPNPGQVTWSGAASWNSVYSQANIDSYLATLKATFPDDYFFVVLAANNLLPNRVPDVFTYRHVADGIGMNSVTGVGVPNICRYNIGGGTVIPGSFGVLDHEIGHNWGVFIGTPMGGPHWLSNSTVNGQMATMYSDDGYVTDKQISGDPIKGFSWTAIDNLAKNESELFAPQDLYAMGLNESFPDTYVLTSPVYKPDHSMGYSAVAKYDQSWVELKNGVRNPDYRSSPKRFRIAVVYIARDSAEVLTAYQQIERSITQFSTAEQLDRQLYRFQVPFLVETSFRASVDARLADLDGNHTPTLSLDNGAYFVSGDGTASVPFTAADADGPAPTVSCVPVAANCSVSGNRVALSGLSSGARFFTIKAQDAGGKKTFAHFVIDVH